MTPGSSAAVSARLQNALGQAWHERLTTRSPRSSSLRTACTVCSWNRWLPPETCSASCASPELKGQRGSRGAAGEQLWVADRQGNKKRVAVPQDLVLPPPVPFPHGELMQTAYEQAHAFGTDLAPYTRLVERMRARIEGRDADESPPLATFADGVAGQAVIDAMRLSSQEERWVDVVLASGRKPCAA